MILSTRLSGIIEALLSATFFGLIPILFMPIYEMGISPETSLIYRFGFATLIMFGVIKYKKQTLRLPLKTQMSVALGALSYYTGALLLYTSLVYIPSGVAVTIFFANPIFIMLLMAFVYKENIEPYKIILSLTTLLGIALFSGIFNSNLVLNSTGLILALISSFAFACYVIALFRLQDANIGKEVISFHLFMSCTVYASVFCFMTDELVLAESGFAWILLILSALLTAVLPNVLLMSAIKKIGSVLASILGVMDPITAVIIGVLIFDEVLNFYIVSGIVIVLLSVLLITILPMHKRTN